MKEGEIVKYDFEVYADDKLIDTSKEELAKEHDSHKEDFNYGPVYIISGMEGSYPGIKNAIEQAEEGGEAEVEIPPKNAFGERNPRDLDYFRYSDIALIASKQEKEVTRGEKIEIHERIGIITLVTPSRVRVDFNHELAGKKLKAKVRILEVLKENEELINAILEMNVGTSKEFEFSEEDGILNIKVPSAISLGNEWTNVKLKVVTQIRKHTGIKNIRYVEEFFQKTHLQEEKTEDGEVEMEYSVSEGEKEPIKEEAAEEPTSEEVTEEPTKEVEEITDEEASEESNKEVEKIINIPEERGGIVGSDAAVAEPENE